MTPLEKFIERIMPRKVECKGISCKDCPSSDYSGNSCDDTRAMRNKIIAEISTILSRELPKVFLTVEELENIIASPNFDIIFNTKKIRIDLSKAIHQAQQEKLL